jgi:hypothetical protein
VNKSLCRFTIGSNSLLSLAIQNEHDIVFLIVYKCIGSHKNLLNVFFSHPFDNISEFARRQRAVGEDDAPRAVKDIILWKATELRLDLILYMCPVFYMGYLTKSNYDHLMLLYVTIRLLLDNDS